MQKPIFTNEIIAAQNKYWLIFQKDFIDSQDRKWNVITMKSTKSWNWSFVLALTKDQKIILNKEYKFWPDDFIYNFPSWFIEKWLSWEENIKNELQEESGYTTDEKIVYLWKTMINWYIYWYNKLYFTFNCYNNHTLNTHEWEEIESTFPSIEEFEQMLSRNEILDPYSEITYYRAKKLTNNFTNLNI